MTQSLSLQAQKKTKFPFAHTFSIIACDPQAGEMGVAVQSHWFSVGSIVTWAEAGVGVIATQAMANVGYGPVGLQYLRDGYSSKVTLAKLLSQDDHAQIRQVAILDVNDNIAAHTGTQCIAEAGHRIGENYSTQANMMHKNTVWDAMADTFETQTGTLADRMLHALEAGQQAGGDVRGQQSAAMLIVKMEKMENPWDGVLCDLRVEDHPDPINELQRLIRIQHAYQLMNTADELITKGDFAMAAATYEKAAVIAPDNIEIAFWHAIALAEIGRLSEALPVFHSVFHRDKHWALLLLRLPAAGLLHTSDEIMKQILSQGE
jgi:uncharacterized Ntn-hydrolase superfamily protein